MALTRKFLKAMGIEEEKIEQIIEAHGETVDALKEERDNYKADAEKLADVQKKLTKAEDALAKKGDGETVLKEDFDKLKDEYDKYKAGIDAEKLHTAKETAFRELLKAAGVSEKRIASVLKVTDIDGVEIDKDGKIKDAEKHTEDVKSEWADFIETTTTKGANTANPPANNGKGVKTKEEIYKMENGRYVLSASERQAELAKLYQSEKGD